MYVIYKAKTVYYEVTGEGYPVVLLHGYMESLEIWGEFANELAKEFQVIRIDLPGHGKSGVIQDVHTMELLAEAINRVIEKVTQEKVVLTGHSLGGYVTLAFAERFPERLAGFCLFHSHPLPDTEETVVNREREIALVRAGEKHLIYQVNIPKAFADENKQRLSADIQNAIDIARKTPDEGIIAMLRGMMQRPDRKKILKKSIIPGLWILGEKDNYIPYHTMVSAVHPGKGIHVVSLKNSGHMGFIEERERSCDLVRNFVRQVNG